MQVIVIVVYYFLSLEACFIILRSSLLCQSCFTTFVPLLHSTPRNILSMPYRHAAFTYSYQHRVWGVSFPVPRHVHAWPQAVWGLTKVRHVLPFGSILGVICSVLCILHIPTEETLHHIRLMPKISIPPLLAGSIQSLRRIASAFLGIALGTRDGGDGAVTNVSHQS